MRVLGVDPGLTRCGVGVVEGDLGRRLATMVDVTVVRSGGDAHAAAAAEMRRPSRPRWSPATAPTRSRSKRVFADVNVLSVMGTAQASAVAMLVAARHDIPVFLHTPTEVKAAVTGSGRADKAQVTAMVTRLLRLPAPPTPADAADALALAICHLWRGAATNRIEQAAAAVRAQHAAAAAGPVGGRVAR